MPNQPPETPMLADRKHGQAIDRRRFVQTLLLPAALPFAAALTRATTAAERPVMAVAGPRHHRLQRPPLRLAVNTPTARTSLTRTAIIVCAALALAGVSSLRAEYPQDEKAYPGHGYSWENNSLGMEEVVPAPWTPLRHDREAVECWGRRYEFGSGALPVQITSQGRKLFAAPPAIAWRVDGKDAVMDDGGRVSPGLTAAHKSVRTWESM